MITIRVIFHSHVHSSAWNALSHQTTALCAVSNPLKSVLIGIETRRVVIRALSSLRRLKTEATEYARVIKRAFQRDNRNIVYLREAGLRVLVGAVVCSWRNVVQYMYPKYARYWLWVRFNYIIQIQCGVSSCKVLDQLASSKYLLHVFSIH